MPAANRSRLIVVGSVLVALAALGFAVVRGRGGDEAGGPFPNPDYRFGEVVQGTPVEHAFTVRNRGDSEMRIKRLAGSYGITVVRIDSVLRPGATGEIRLAVDTRQRAGTVAEMANVYTASDSTRPAATLRLLGSVVRPLQLSPQDRVYFFTTSGKPERREITIINHQQKPLRVLSATADNPLFTVQQQALQDGKRYKVTVALDPKTPVGRHEGTVTVKTDQAAYATVPIKVLALIDHPVSTSAKVVNFASIPFDAADRPVLGQQQILVKSHRGGDFRVLRATSDVPYLKVDVQPVKQGESFMVNVTIDKKRTRPGQQIKGTLTIETNDPEFPRLQLPIRGNLV